jgi:metal-sulfur cluster biosynthetic enzyme
MSDLLDRVDAALDAVHDPCSVAVNAPLGIRDMGLVLERRVDEGGRAYIRLCVTGPSCILVGSIIRGIEERVSALDGISAVQVAIDAGHIWTEDDMTASGRAALAEARQLSRARFPVTPRQWQRGSSRPGAAARPAPPVPLVISPEP